MMTATRQRYTLDLRGKIRYLQDRLDTRTGRYILLEQMEHNGSSIYHVVDVDGEGFDAPHPLDAVAGGGWPKPNIVFVKSEKRDGIGHVVIDNVRSWCRQETVGFAFRKKSADAKAYERARRIADIVSRRTGLPLIERTERYSGTRKQIGGK